MTRATRTYGHFCVLARALEQVGDRWTLLVVRDLLLGPRRFTDLLERLGGITPKTLAQRLRELEAHGILSVDREPGRREVWYQLTASGQDLGPVLAELARWAMHHAMRAPEEGEPLHVEHVLTALTVVLEQGCTPDEPVRWSFRCRDGLTYALGDEAGHWTLTQVAAGAIGRDDVTISATKAVLARFLSTRPADRAWDDPELTIDGDSASVDRMRECLERFPGAIERAPAG